MIIRTTKQIINEHLKEWDDDNREFVMFNPEEVFEESELDKTRWVLLSDLKKEILRLGGSIQDRDDLVSELLDLCNSSEQNEIFCSPSVFGEHNTGEESTTDVTTSSHSLRKSSPVQNPENLGVSRLNTYQKRCTCKPKPRRGGMGVEVNCGRCGGAL